MCNSVTVTMPISKGFKIKRHVCVFAYLTEMKRFYLTCSSSRTVSVLVNVKAIFSDKVLNSMYEKVHNHMMK